MKKILIIIFLILAIFQMVVLTAAIDIGSEAENRTAMRNIIWTRVDGNNAANASGKITTIEIWAAEALASCKIGIFYRPDPTGNPNKLTTRDYCTIQIAGQSAGVVPAGSKQTATVDLDVVEGDFIGVCGTGQIEGTSATGAWWYVDSALIPYDNTTFYTASPYTISLKGTGATVEVATGNAIMMGFNF